MSKMLMCSKKVIGLFRIVLLSSLVANRYIIGSDIEVSAVVKPDLENKIRNDRHLLDLDAKWTRNLIYCVAVCARIPECVSVFYNAGSHMCYGHSATFGNIDARIDGIPSPKVDSGTKYYTLLKGYIGDACKTGDDCITANSECRDSVCLCSPGFSFYPSGRTCTADCSDYGNDFLEVFSSFISSNNIQTVNNITLEECKRICTDATSYTCRTFEVDWITRDCFLQNVTVLQVASKEWHLNFDDAYSHFQRDCA